MVLSTTNLNHSKIQTISFPKKSKLKPKIIFREFVKLGYIGPLVGPVSRSRNRDRTHNTEPVIKSHKVTQLQHRQRCSRVVASSLDHKMNVEIVPEQRDGNRMIELDRIELFRLTQFGSCIPANNSPESPPPLYCPN